MPYTLDLFARYTKFDKWTIARYNRVILNTLNIRIPERNITELITIYGNQLNLSYTVQRSALKILQRAHKLGITAGKDPKGLTAAALYIAAIKMGEFKPQKEIAKVVNITEITIRNRYKEFVKVLQIKIL